MHPIDILFWTCLMLGGVYTLFNLFMGGLSHAAGHVSHIGHALHVPSLTDVAHHVGIGDSGHGGHAAHADTGAHGQHADGHANRGEAESQTARFNLFVYMNPLSIASFMVGFGGIGVACGLLVPAMQPLTKVLYAGAGGWGLWLLAYLSVSRMFARAEGSSQNTMDQVIGLRACVTAPIAGRQPGMVAYTVAGMRQTLRAIADEEDGPIPIGAMVRIQGIEHNTARVLRLD